MIVRHSTRVLNKFLETNITVFCSLFHSNDSCPVRQLDPEICIPLRIAIMQSCCLGPQLSPPPLYTITTSVTTQSDTHLCSRNGYNKGSVSVDDRQATQTEGRNRLIVNEKTYPSPSKQHYFLLDISRKKFDRATRTNN